MAVSKYKITSKALNVRKKSSLDSEVLGVIREPGKIVDISVKRNGFGKLAGVDGWICLDYAVMV